MKLVPVCFPQPINKEKEDCVFPLTFAFMGALTQLNRMFKYEENPLFSFHLRLSTSFQVPLEDKHSLFFLLTVLFEDLVGCVENVSKPRSEMFTKPCGLEPLSAHI